MEEQRTLDIAREQFTDQKYELRSNIISRVNLLQEEYNKQNNEMAEIIGMPNQSNSNATKYSSIFKSNGTSNPKAIELLYIVNICKKFNVSFNWLTGQSSINNRQDKYKDIVSATPLTEDSIEMLEQLKRAQTRTKYQKRIDLLNYIIETANKEEGILDLLVQYLFPDFEAQDIYKQFDGNRYSRTFKEEDIAKLFLFNIESGLVKERREFKKYIENGTAERDFTTFD